MPTLGFFISSRNRCVVVVLICFASLSRVLIRSRSVIIPVSNLVTIIGVALSLGAVNLLDLTASVVVTLIVINC